MDPADPPLLTTERLTLRAFALRDAPEVQRLAGAREVAATTARLPHPYPDGAAEVWILSQRGAWERGEELVLAIVRREDDALLGAIGLTLAGADRRAELGYWIGVPYWGRGYATEAARALLDYGFRVLALERIHAHHMTCNPASGRVLHKAGMAHEGRLRRHLMKWGRLEDLELYGILRDEYLAAPAELPPSAPP
jgi:ribosomal-protein-alanine N-acetyltransferase